MKSAPNNNKIIEQFFERGKEKEHLKELRQEVST